MKKYEEFNKINESKKQDIYRKYKASLEDAIEKLELSNDFKVGYGIDVSNKENKGFDYISFDFLFDIQTMSPVSSITLEEFESYKKGIINFMEQFNPYKDAIQVLGSQLAISFYILPENIEKSNYANSLVGIDKYKL